MGPSTEEALELVQQARGGTGRHKREIEHGIDLNNLIPVCKTLCKNKKLI
jgi:hypothetical protein